MSGQINRAFRVLDLFSGLLGKLLLALSLLFLLLPALLIIVLSFGTGDRVSFPPQGWGFDRYVSVFTSGNWGEPIVLSFEIAIFAALGAMIVALPLVFASKRSKLPGSGLLLGLAYAPVVMPISAYAVGMYAVFGQLGIIGTHSGIVFAHIAIALPMVTIVLNTSLQQIRPELELAAMTMGASRLRAWTGITLRLLTPAMVSGLLFGFVTSFDEAVFISFLGGPGLVTLPKYIFDSVQYSVDPAITAVSTILMIGVTLLMVFSSLLQKEKK